MIDALLLICLCLVACFSESSSRPHQPSVLFKSQFFHPLHRITFHPAKREREREKRSYSILDGVALCFLCLLVYVMIRTYLLPPAFFFLFGLICYVVRCICAHIYLQVCPLAFLLFAFFTHLLQNSIFFSFLFSFLLVSVVPRSACKTWYREGIKNKLCRGTGTCRS